MIPGISSGGGSLDLQGGDAKSGNGDFATGGNKYFNFGSSGDMPGWMLDFARADRAGTAVGGLSVPPIVVWAGIGLAVYLIAKKR